MPQIHSPRTSLANGRLWGNRAQDWVDIQESQCSEAYEVVFEGFSLGAGMRLCDVGCGSTRSMPHMLRRWLLFSKSMAATVWAPHSGGFWPRLEHRGSER